MPYSAFNGLPDDTQLWIYGFSNPLGEADRRVVAERLEPFLATWNNHDAPVTGAWTVLEDRFVLLAGHSPTGVSGCSIDTCMANFKWLKENHDLDGLDRGRIFFRDADGVAQSSDRLNFQQMVDAGSATMDTRVFDTTLTTLGDLRAGRFEARFADCWHAKLFTARSVADGTSTR